MKRLGFLILLTMSAYVCADDDFGRKGFSSSGDNPVIPEEPDLSGLPVRSHLLDQYVDRNLEDLADLVIEGLKKESLLEATEKGKKEPAQYEPTPEQSQKLLEKPVRLGYPHATHPVVPDQTGHGHLPPYEKGSLDPTSLDQYVSDNLNSVFQDPGLNKKKISLTVPEMNIQKLFDIVSRLGDITIVVDKGIKGSFGPLKMKDKTPGQILKVIINNFDPKLALTKQDDDVWKVSLFKNVSSQLKKSSAQQLVTKSLPIKHARINDRFKHKVEDVWKSVNGGATEKDPSKFLYVDDEERKVLVRGHPLAVQDLYKFLFEIDKPLIQVRIDAILVLAQKSFDFAFGFDWSGIYNRQETMERGNGSGFWGFGARMTDYPTPTSSTVENNSNLLVDPNNFAINLFSSINSLFSDKADIRRIADFMKIPFVFGGPDLNLKRLNLVLNAAETYSKLKIVSRPSVLTSNNEIAKLLIGQSIPLQTAIEDVTTSNTRNISTINFKDTGIVLEVKPTVSADGKSVSLDIFLEDSQVISGDTKANDQGVMQDPPTISVIKAKNNVILKSGQTTIIGGLSGNRNRSASNKVPFLNKIPILGNLFFSSDFDYNEEDERYIFITPTIIQQEV